MMVAIPYFLAGLLAIALIDTVGAIASRVFRFNYAYLSILSLVVYTAMGYLVARKAGFSIALLVNLALGFFDATVGLKLSMWAKANLGAYKDEVENTPVTHMLTIMLFVSMFFAYIGYLCTRL